MWTSEDRRCTGSLLLSSLLQLDLCTISPALYFLYTVLLERGREGGESWGWVYACGRRGEGGCRQEDAEGERRELQRQMTSSSDQAEYWMTVLQVGAEAVLSSEWYIFKGPLNCPALISQGRIAAAETRQADRGAARAYSVLSDLENVKGKLEAEMIVLCCEVERSSGLAQTPFWICLTPPCRGTRHCVCQLLSSPANLLTSSDRMRTCRVQPIRGWSQTGSEHSVCLPGLYKWLEDFSSNKWIDFLPSLLIQKTGHVGKWIAFDSKNISLCQWC